MAGSRNPDPRVRGFDRDRCVHKVMGMRSGWWAGFLLLCSCAGPWAPVDRGLLPKATDYPDQDAILLHEQVILQYGAGSSGPSLKRTVSKRLLVLTPRGSDAAQLAVGYDRSFSQVLSARARVSHPDGRIETFDLSDMGDHPAFGGSILYADSRLLEKGFGVLAPGTVVDWQAVVESSTPSWQVDRYGFGARIPLQSARYEVRLPQGWQIEHVATQQWRPLSWAPEVEPFEGGQRVVWQRQDLAAVESEPRAPGLWDLMPIVTVRLTQWTEGGAVKHGFASMQEYGRWMYQVQDGANQPSPALRAQVAQILSQAPPEPRARAAALYEWVQAQIRYVAVEVGMGGWRPHDAQEVLKHGYGDCKDKANLLRAMLSVAGIDSHLVELYSHAGVPRPYLLPGVGNGNHAILAVHLPEGLILADPTERTVPFGDLPPRDQGAQTLIIHPDTPAVHTTSPQSAQDNLKTLRISLKVPHRGVKAEGSAVLTTRGAFAWQLRREVMTQSKGTEDQTFEAWDWLRDAKVSKAKYLTEDPTQAQGEAHVKVAQLGTELGARLIFRPSGLLYTPGDDLTKSQRTQAVIYSSAITRDTELRLELGEAQVSELPEAVHIKSAFGEFQQSWSLQDHNLVVHSIYRRTTRRVEPHDYGAFVAFCDEIIKARGQQVIIRRGSES